MLKRFLIVLGVIILLIAGVLGVQFDDGKHCVRHINDMSYLG